MNCNKVKALDVTSEDIVKAIKDSSLLELDSSEKKFRRKDNKPVPTLKLLKQKRKNNDDENDLDENPDAQLDP